MEAYSIGRNECFNSKLYLENGELPKGRRQLGVFTMKHRSNDKIKCKMVAQGFTQSFGTSYEVTIAPVTKFNSIEVLLSLNANLYWELHQMDVKHLSLMVN